MASLPHSLLTALQRDVLRAFFARERDFYLTGGAALAGYHLGHRATDDLDLFTADPAAFARGGFGLEAVAGELGGTLEIRQNAPLFRRFVLTRHDGGLVIDLVCDGAGGPAADRPEHDGARVDTPETIVNGFVPLAIGVVASHGRPLRLLSPARP